VVDCQRAFTDRGHATTVVRPDETLAKILGLVDVCRRLSLPVIATRHVHRRHPGPGGMGSWWRTFLTDDDESSQLSEGLSRLRPDTVIEKDRYSAFGGTPLEGLLEEAGVRTLFLCGFMTHICVESTARAAFDLGYDVAVVADACSSISEDLHAAALACMSHALAHIVDACSISGPAGGRS
jgi:ureidoacrylate peracid hydrolase